jgi:hydroxymethylpyrimidine pyrophosphatase-like HAD family hydrolase
VKEELKMHTMAIGDGANDVSMIQVPAKFAPS